MLSTVEKIGLFDMDGTLCNYEGRMIEDLKALRSPGEPEITSIHGDVPDWLENRMSLIKRQPGWWRNLPVLSDGLQVFEYARDLGFENHILTKGPYKTTTAWTEKVEWVRKTFEEPNSPQEIDWVKPTHTQVKIHITEDKGLVYGTMLCEDWPPYIDRWLKWRKRGLVVLLDRPYNREYTITEQKTHGVEIRKYDRGNEHPQIVRYEDTEEKQKYSRG
jgi:5'-nucleotidase